jgi:hypothetical protein
MLSQPDHFSQLIVTGQRRELGKVLKSTIIATRMIAFSTETEANFTGSQSLAIRQFNFAFETT